MSIGKGKLILKDANELGRGMERICFLHPENSQRVIKVSYKNNNKQNLYEYKSYKYIIKRNAQVSHISKYHGFVETDLGPGLVSDCIRDCSGQISTSLFDILIYKLDYDLEQIKNVVGKFGDYLIKNNIQLFDLNVKNIVIQILESGQYYPVSIDLKGRYANNEFIPFSTYIPFFSKKKLIRRRAQLLQRIDYFYDNGHLFREGAGSK